MGIHTLTDGHAQVLCIKENSHIAIESLTLLQDHGRDKPCSTEQGECKDIYLGNGHPDTTGIRTRANFQPQELQTLQHLLPLVLQPIALKPTSLCLPSLSFIFISYSPPVHIPSTVLLI